MSVSKFVNQLNKLSGAVTEVHNPFDNPLRTPSPSVNSIYGNSWGLPLGYSSLIWGPMKGGKSLLSNAIIGQMHQDDPEAIAVIFDTEMRREGQLTPEIAAFYGIDLDRLVLFMVNKPGEVWDRIQYDIAKLCKEGAKIKLVIVDSITGILGRREADSDSIDRQQRGDQAITNQLGLQRILQTQRQCKFHLILTAHARAEMDPHAVMRGMTTKAAAAYGVLHHCEYFVYVERNITRSGKVDELGNEFKDESREDITGSAEQTGHKVRVWMQDSSLGPKDRSGEFTINYKQGIVNTYEEVFKLGTNLNVITKTGMTYSYKGQKWVGRPQTLAALEADKDLQNQIIADMMALEKSGTIKDKLDLKEDKEENPEDASSR